MVANSNFFLTISNLLFIILWDIKIMISILSWNLQLLQKGGSGTCVVTFLNMQVIQGSESAYSADVLRHAAVLFGLEHFVKYDYLIKCLSQFD